VGAKRLWRTVGREGWSRDETMALQACLRTRRLVVVEGDINAISFVIFVVDDFFSDVENEVEISMIKWRLSEQLDTK
jgi:hypothetical protein